VTSELFELFEMKLELKFSEQASCPRKVNLIGVSIGQGALILLSSPWRQRRA
jgi:hypothetical protein